MNTQPNSAGGSPPDPFVRAERRAKKWIWGCTGGCLGAIIAFGALVVIAVHVLMRAVPVVPAEVFLDRQATAFLAVRIEPDDPLMVAIPYRLFANPRVRRAAAAVGAPELAFDARKTEAVVLETSPLRVVAIGHPGEGEKPLGGGMVFSVHRGSRLLRLAVSQKLDELGRAGATVSSYKDAQLAALPNGSIIAYRTNNFMWADNKDLVRRWTDSLERQRELEQQEADRQELAPPDLNEGLKPAYERLEHSRPLLFAASNAHGEIGRLLDLLCPKGEWRELLAATGIASDNVVDVSVQMEPLNAVSAAVSISVGCADEDSAARLARRMQPIADRLAKETPIRDVELHAEAGILHMKARLLNAPESLAMLVGRALSVASRDR